MRRYSSACPLLPRASTGSGVSLGSGRRSLTGCRRALRNGQRRLDRIAHLSDLHFVGERYGCRMESGTQGPRGNRCIRRALRKLAAIHASSPLDRVLVTGDVTDAGTRAEWAEFLDLIRSFPVLRDRLSFVPGNHDVNIVDRHNTGRFDLPWSAGQALRKLRVVLALDALQGTPRLRRRSKVRCARTVAKRLPAGSRTRRTSARAGRTRRNAWTARDVEGLGRDLPFG